MPDDIPLESLLAPTEAFIKTMYAIRHAFSFEPTKEHIATCINYVDLQEMRDDFIREMRNMVKGFVYCAQKQKAMVAQFQTEGRDEGQAWTQLYQRACDKFRHSDLKGQIAELLLCNLLQHYFRAVPLLRKMPITTNPNNERNGADAIHVAGQSGNWRLYIGEAKTYHRQKYSFRLAVTECLQDVLEHYANHRRELSLYTYEDFLTPELETLARQYQNGDPIGAEVHMVCIATYNCDRAVAGKSKDELLNRIIDNMVQEADAIKTNAAFTGIPPALVPRINFILFSVHDLNNLVEAFAKGFASAA